MLNDLLTCIEFLTRWKPAARQSWRDDAFARSVPWFPAVGLLMGLAMGAGAYLLFWLNVPYLLRAALLILWELLLIGSLMYDGFMDSCDGLFSARDRERMLEIMKDSHVGANAVIGLCSLVLVKFSALASLRPDVLPLALIVLYVARCTHMVLYIVKFPCARPDGIARLFANGAKSSYVTAALLFYAAVLLVSFGVNPAYALAALTSFVCSLLAACYVKRQLGGLTGDTYGFLTEVGTAVYLLALLILGRMLF